MKTEEDYTAAYLEENDAFAFAQEGVEAFKCEISDKYYTYPEIAPEAPTVPISENENDNMSLIEWNGTFPVYKRRKMFPRN